MKQDKNKRHTKRFDIDARKGTFRVSFIWYWFFMEMDCKSLVTIRYFGLNKLQASKLVA